MTYVRTRCFSVVGRVVAILFLLLSPLVAKALLTVRAVTVAFVPKVSLSLGLLVILFPSLAGRCVKRRVAMAFVLGLVCVLVRFLFWLDVVEASDEDGVEFNVLVCRVDILGTNCDQCLSMVQCCFMSTETLRLIRTGNPGRPPRLLYVHRDRDYQGRGAQDGHLDFHTAPEFWSLRELLYVAFYLFLSSSSPVGGRCWSDE